MRRLGGSVLASVILHAAILVWVAARWTRWRDAFERPEPQPIEVEAVAEPAPTAAPAGGHGGGGATVARAPRPRARTRTVTVEPMGTEPVAEVPGPPAVEPGPATVGEGAGPGPRSGAGSGSGAGSVPGPGAGSNVAALIAARVDAHKRYPLLARRQGREGTVELLFRVNPAGRAEDLRVAVSAGEPFDSAALAAVRESEPLPPCNLPVRLPIRFRLTDGRAIR